MAKQLAVVLIKDADVEERSVGGYTFHEQRGLLVLGEDESLSISISLPRGHAGYPVGRYYLGGGSFDRDKYQRPCFSSRGLELIPVPAATAAKPAG